MINLFLILGSLINIIDYRVLEHSIDDYQSYEIWVKLSNVEIFYFDLYTSPRGLILVGFSFLERKISIYVKNINRYFEEEFGKNVIFEFIYGDIKKIYFLNEDLKITHATQKWIRKTWINIGLIYTENQDGGYYESYYVSEDGWMEGKFVHGRLDGLPDEETICIYKQGSLVKLEQGDRLNCPNNGTP